MSGTGAQRNTALPARLLMAALAFAAVNLAIYCLLGPIEQKLDAATFRNGNLSSPLYHSWTWWLVHEFVRQKKAPDIVLIGSSQINSPSWAADAHTSNSVVECIEHREVHTLECALQRFLPQNIAVFNCGMQGGFASDYFMLERALFTDERKPKLVVVAVSPRDFIDNKLTAACTTEPFRFFSQFVDAGNLHALAYTDQSAMLSGCVDEALKQVPLRRLGDLIATHLAASTNQSATKKTCQLAQAVSNGAQRVEPGDYTVLATMKDVWIDNYDEYKKRYANSAPPSYQAQLTFFEQFLADLKEKGCSIIVVSMPIQKCNHKLLPLSFWADFNQRIAACCKRSNGSFYDLSEDGDFRGHDFWDTVHLNDLGGIRFFNKLAGIISGDKQAVAALASPRDLASGEHLQ